jgi:hypothetical protein
VVEEIIEKDVDRSSFVLFGAELPAYTQRD